MSLAGAVEWPHSVCTIGATLATIIINQSTLVDIWKWQKHIDKRSGEWITLKDYISFYTVLFPNS